MSNIPNKAVKIEVDGATVDFFKVTKDSQSIYYFDTSLEGPPSPMVNAMKGLGLIKGTTDKLVMISHTAPNGLFAKLEADVSHKTEELQEDLVKVVFSSLPNAGIDSDLTQTSCSG